MDVDSSDRVVGNEMSISFKGAISSIKISNF